MAQKTLVLQVPARDHDALRDRLAGGAFEFRTVPHAVFSVKGGGAVATLYRSGKLVVQGADPEAFVAAHTDLEVRPVADAAESPAAKRLARVDRPLIGSDESGKGDYFGPLVVCAAYVEPEDLAELREAGVMDSKRLTDNRAMVLGAWLRGRVPFVLERLDPPDYNRVYPRYRGLNPLLAELHGKAIRGLLSHERVAARTAGGSLRVVVDQFASERLVREALAGQAVDLEQAHRAEINPAVAAASVVARQEYLACLADLSRDEGIELKKGAGEPVDRAGVELVRERGVEALERVAKVHFRNTEKIRAKVGV